MNISEEIRQIEHRDWIDFLRRREEEARARFFCCECGSMDGMAAYQREVFEGYSPGQDEPTYWLLRGSSHHDIFRPCWQCNSTGEIPSGYVAIGWSKVVRWLESPCLCRDCILLKEEIDGRNL